MNIFSLTISLGITYIIHNQSFPLKFKIDALEKIEFTVTRDSKILFHPNVNIAGCRYKQILNFYNTL